MQISQIARFQFGALFVRTGQIWERPSNRKACSVVLSPTHGSSGLQGVTLAEQLWELKEEICRKPISSIPLRARRLTAILECWRIRRKSRPISCGSRSNWGQVMLRPLWVKSCTDACYVTMLLISRASQCLKWTSLHLECCIDRFLVERIVKKKKKKKGFVHSLWLLTNWFHQRFCCVWQTKAIQVGT